MTGGITGLIYFCVGSGCVFIGGVCIFGIYYLIKKHRKQPIGVNLENYNSIA